MRRLLVVRLDAFQLQRFHRAGLPLDFLFQALQQFALLDDDAVQLLDLVFQVSDVRFKFFGAPGIFVCHEMILPAPPPEVESLAERYMPAHHLVGRDSRRAAFVIRKDRLAGTLAPPV